MGRHNKINRRICRMLKNPSVRSAYLWLDVLSDNDFSVVEASGVPVKPWLYFFTEKLSRRHFSFSFEELSSIASILAKLPSSYLNARRFLLASLISRIGYLIDRGLMRDYKEDYVDLFRALIRLPYDFLRYQHVFTAIAYNFFVYVSPGQVNERLLRKSGITSWELWVMSALVYIKSPYDANAKTIFNKAINMLPNRTIRPRVEEFKTQSLITENIRELLSFSVSKDLKTEYPIGPYRLDVAIPSRKIAVEIDGLQHYAERRLRVLDMLRDFILERIFGWKTVRLPYFEYGCALNRNMLRSYLIAKLSAYTGLLHVTDHSKTESEHAWSKCYLLRNVRNVSHRTPRRRQSIVFYTQKMRFFCFGHGDRAVVNGDNQLDESRYVSIRNYEKKATMQITIGQ